MRKSSISWDLAIFKSHESFSPFLLISWDPMRWGEVLLEGDGVWSLIIKSRESSRHFFSSHGIQLDLPRPPPPPHEKFSPSRGINRLKLLMKMIFPLYFDEIKFLLGSPIFQSRESFSPFLLISWDSFCPDPKPSMRSSLHLVGFTD